MGIRPLPKSDRMKCEWCESDFFQAKPWQKFCKSKCRDDWHNRERLQRQLEAAEERRENRINGHDGSGHSEIDLAALGLVTKPVELRRRRV
jgi:hypothetical protein